MDFLNTCGQKRCVGKNLEQDKAATTRNIKTQCVKMGKNVQILFSGLGIIINLNNM